MPTYAVYEPPVKADEIASDPEGFAFIRDGFSFWAFLASPLWMLRHRMWIVLAGYVVLTAALGVALHLGNSPGWVGVLAALLIAFFVGFEAPTMRAFTATRRPSRSHPTEYFIHRGWRFEWKRRLSWRDSVIFTGRPVRWARSAAWHWTFRSSFAPTRSETLPK